MLREIWKIFKLNLWLAKEEIAAMSAMMAGACISLFMIGCFAPAVILGLIFAVAGFLTLAKAVFRILVSNEYGDAQVLIKSLPFEEKSRKIARLLGAGSVLFLNFAEVVLTLWGGYIGFHEYRLSASAGFLKWLYGWGGLSVSVDQIWAALPVKILFLLTLALCTAAVYEYTVTRAHSAKARGKSGGRLFSESYTSYFSPLWLPALILGIFGRILPIYIANETFSFFFPAVQAAITGAVLVGVVALMKKEENAAARLKSSPYKGAESRTPSMYATGKNLSKYRAYTELIRVGRSVNWQMAFCLLPIAIAFRNAENLGLGVIGILTCTLTFIVELTQVWHTTVLFDDNATFYYSLPLSTEEVVRAHMEIGCRIILPVTLLLCGGVPIAALFPGEEKTAAEVIGQLIGQTGGKLEMWLLCGLWVLAIAAMCLAFSGWALFNSAFASRWREPVTRKSGHLAGGVTLVAEVAAHIVVLVVATPFTYVNPLVGSLILLLLLAAECYGVYRLNVAELRDRYSA